MKRIIALCVIAITSWVCCKAQTVTWSQDIACIVNTHCIRCHNNTNSIAAIPFTNYNEAWANRLAIRYYVQNKLMPPYQPVTENRHYSQEKNLTEEEIALIVAWVDQGTNQGDSSLAPPPPSIGPLVSEITAPDLSLRIPAYTVPNIVGFQYRCFVLPTTYPSEKKISEIEILPTALSAVYSVFLYADTSSVPLMLDSADTGNGYASYSGTGSPTSKLLYGWVNGNPLYRTPSNVALRLEANAHLVLRILFAEDAANKTDSTVLNLKFDTTATRIADIGLLLNDNVNLQNPPFIIPADSIKTFYEQYTVPADMSMLGISHWGQKFCSKMNCYAVSPAGDTVNLLKIDDHEDLWSQGFYYFNKLVKVPAGSVLYGEAEYNNTDDNPNNPFVPAHTISAGMSDTSEQMLFSFSYLPYQTNDENIIADTVVHQLHYLNCSPAHRVTGIPNTEPNDFDCKVFPNPATNSLTVQFSNIVSSAQVKIINCLGEIILSQYLDNSASVMLNMNSLRSGVYFIQVRQDGNDIIKKLIKL